MTGASPPLSIALRELEARWAEHGWPIVNELRPGLSEDTIRATCERLHLNAPVEVRAWWSWHDGADRSFSGGASISPSADVLSLAEAIELYQRERRAILDSGVEAADLEKYWSRSYLPLATTGQVTIVIDCSGPDGEPSHIRTIDPQRPIVPVEPAARSLRQAVAWWTEAVDLDMFTFDSGLGVWAPAFRSYSHRANELDATGIV